VCSKLNRLVWLRVGCCGAPSLHCVGAAELLDVSKLKGLVWLQVGCCGMLVLHGA